MEQEVQTTEAQVAPTAATPEAAPAVEAQAAPESLLSGEQKAAPAVEDNRSAGEFILTLPEELRAEKGLQKFKGTDDLAKSYLEQQKMLGKKVEELTAEEIKAIAPKFGAPQSVDEYEFEPLQLPEGMDDTTVWFKQKAFELGIPKDAAQKLRAEFTSMQLEKMEAMGLQAQQTQEESISQLKKEFGSAFDARVSAANKALREFGGDEAVQALASAGLDSNPALVKSYLRLEN